MERERKKYTKFIFYSLISLVLSVITNFLWGVTYKPMMLRLFLGLYPASRMPPSSDYSDDRSLLILGSKANFMVPEGCRTPGLLAGRMSGVMRNRGGLLHQKVNGVSWSMWQRPRLTRMDRMNEISEIYKGLMLSLVFARCSWVPTLSIFVFSHSVDEWTASRSVSVGRLPIFKLWDLWNGLTMLLSTGFLRLTVECSFTKKKVVTKRTSFVHLAAAFWKYLIYLFQHVSKLVRL